MGSEQALWKNPRAFEPLVRFAFDFARRVTGHDADAEDLAQEALLDLAEAEPSKPAAVGGRAFVGRRIVLGAKMLRRARLTRARHEQAAARVEVEGPGEEGADARAALMLLDPEDRHAVELRFLHGLSYAEVAHVLGVSEPAARMRVHRALASLRERLGPRAESMIAALPLFLAPRSLALETARAAALAGGALVMKKIVVAVVVLVAFMGGGVLVSRAMRETAAPPRAGLPLPATVASVPAEAPPASEAPAPEAPPIPIPPGKASVSGRITFDDGEPVRGISVKLSGSPSTPCTTDEDGRFRIEAAWVATRDLVIEKGDALWLRIAKAELKADEALRLDVALERGTRLEGMVAKAGSAVGGARVRLERPGAEGAGTFQGSVGFARTGADGRFEFPYLPKGLYTLVATGDGIEPTSVAVEVAPGLRPQVISVRDARPLRLRFVPVSAAWRGKRLIFGVMNVEGSPIRLNYDRVVDERGEVAVEAPPPGRYMLTQLPGGYRELVVTEASVPEVVIDLRGARVFGRVSVPCEVSVGSVDVRTDAQGNYDMETVPAGRAEVRLRFGRVTIERSPIVVPESGEVRLDVELRGVTVRGRLVALGDYQRWVSMGSRSGAGNSVEVGADGAFAIPYVEPGQYEIYGFNCNAQGETRPITVGQEDLDVGEVVLDPGSEVPVVVVAPAGVRLAGRHDTWAVRGSEHKLVQLYLDESGRGSVRLPAGKWRLSLHVADLEQADLEIEVPATAPVRFDLTR